MKRHDLTATHYVLSRLGAAVLAGLGTVLLFRGASVLVAGAASGSPSVESLGVETKVLSIGLGVAFLLLAWLALERAALRTRVAELTEALHQLLYGKDYRRDREAIEILLAALESQDAANAATAHEHLVRLTGQRFAQDPQVWRSWWAANQRTFAARKGRAAVLDDAPPSP